MDLAPIYNNKSQGTLQAQSNPIGRLVRSFLRKKLCITPPDLTCSNRGVAWIVSLTLQQSFILSLNVFSSLQSLTIVTTRKESKGIPYINFVFYIFWGLKVLLLFSLAFMFGLLSLPWDIPLNLCLNIETFLPLLLLSAHFSSISHYSSTWFPVCPCSAV